MITCLMYPVDSKYHNDFMPTIIHFIKNILMKHFLKTWKFYIILFFFSLNLHFHSILILKQWFSTGVERWSSQAWWWEFCLPGDIWQCLKTFLIVTTGTMGASGIQWALEMLLNILWGSGQSTNNNQSDPKCQ